MLVSGDGRGTQQQREKGHDDASYNLNLYHCGGARPAARVHATARLPAVTAGHVRKDVFAVAPLQGPNQRKPSFSSKCHLSPPRRFFFSLRNRSLNTHCNYRLPV